MKLFYVDDNKLSLLSFEKIAKEKWPQTDCRVFSSAGEYQKALSSESPDMCIVDLRLEGSFETGLSLIESTRRSHPGTFIIAFSSLIDEEIQARAMEKGANMYLFKDGGFEDICEVIESELKKGS